MAASIYATPPPDLSSEDTALSDVSNASSLNNRSSSNSNSNITANNNNSTSCTNNTTTTSTNTAANKQKRSIAEVLASSESQASSANPHSPKQSRRVSPKTSNGGNVTSAAITLEEAIDSTVRDEGTLEDDADMSTTPLADGGASAAAVAAMTAAAANAAAMQLQFLEAINDAAKKRRKQNNPSKVGAQAAAAAAAAAALNLNEGTDGALINAAAEAIIADKDQFGTGGMAPTTLPIDYEDKLSKMFLPKSIEQLKETFELLQQKQHRFGNISPDTGAARAEESLSTPHLIKAKTEIDSEMKTTSNELANEECSPNSQEAGEELGNPYHTFCKTCGENFETEFKLGLHMLQEHQNDETEQESVNRAVDEAQQKAELIPYDMLSSVSVKMERPDYESSTSPPAVTTAGNHNEHHNTNLLSNGKEPWLNTMPGMGFPFPPEAAAAAALSASGYLPLLGMPGFPTVDGLNRPPIRIFNPEAYCDLCNKEFCNKYFLKTHRANKHGIYDPAVSAGSESAANGSGANMSAMTQMLQLQMQQQQQQQSMQQLQQKQQMALEEAQKQQISSQTTNGAPPQQLTPPAPPPVYCDVCSKRFTNVFAMRRHRAKAHDQPRSSPGEPTIPTPPPQQSSVPTSKPDTQSPVAQNESKHDLSNISSPTDTEGKQFQMPDGFRQDFTLEQEEVAFTPQPRKLSPQSQQQARDANFSHDKLRRLGVVNPEAFCEICCKEYCNKYFLRTHKWKRHGIFVPPDDLKDEQLQLAQKMPWPFMGLPGMPLNLMMANDKALMAQRMFAAATSNVSTASNMSADDTPQHIAKRIKLEQDDEEVSRGNDENQENKCLSGRQSAEQQQQQTGSHSVASTPEPQKILAESYNSGANMPASPETAVGLQNLQKLQSMIQQLNDLNGKRSMGCHLCGREMENQYALQVHMMTDHAGLLDGSSTLPLNFQQHLFQQQQQMQAQQQQQVLKHSPSGSPGIMPPLNEMRCNQCDRDFANIQEFKQHIAEVHLLPGSPLRDGFATPERPINPNAASMGSRPPYTITPTSSYCEICNKELCNKYFMKTHMQRMHGIEIENGAQIGGVVCNICNKELCSKYFLRVHKQNTHGIVDEGAPLPQPRQNGLNFDAQQQQQQQQQQMSSVETDLNRGLNLSPFGSGNSGDSKSDYANYAEVCVICTRRFRSAKWLRAHLQSDHGPAGIEKLRELEQQYGPLSKSSSPTLKIPNGSASSGSNSNNINATTGTLPNPANLAQALQNLNAQHLLGNMPKNILPGMFAAAAEQTQSTPRLQEYQCSICPFTTPYYAFLFIHERSHTLLGGAGEMSLTAPEHLMPGGGIKDETNGSGETKSRSDSNNTVMTDKSSLLSVAQANNKTMESGRVEPTNLSTRSSSPSGSTKKSKSTKENQVQRNAKQSETKESQKEIVTTKSFAHIKVEKTRTIATSPISTAANNTFAQVALNDLAEKCGKVASYAVPKDVAGDGPEEGEPQMQAFVLEIQHEREMDTMPEGASAEESSNSNRFVPAIVYLPVRRRISGPVTVSFNLTPA
ncbi:uncharacterized protein LOC105214834 [Zeugodacus cucurbitae]|uniref:uncharacterized protein LOC105214834 n=1 Tax=Zeugodacus cucurbitae TaxID=28588 RepID=UPI0023D96326|nr:uncharacterized protein LOC105214834 [Zeugodacus cucurbitae]